MKKLIFISKNILTLGFCAFALAASGDLLAKKTQRFEPGFDPSHATYSAWLSDKEFAAQKKAAQTRARRDPARNMEANEQMLSATFKTLRTQFLSIKDKDQLHSFIEALDERYDTLSPDEKLFAADLIPLRAFRGFVLKVRPLAEQARILHSGLLTQLQQMAVSQEILLPTDQWKAGFDYVTQPYDGIDTNAYFTTEHALQRFIATVVVPEIQKATKRIQAIEIDSPIVWDNQMFYGSASFVDNRERYRLVGKAEKANLMARHHITLSQLTSFASYSVKDGVKLARRLGQLRGIDGFGSEGVTGMTAEKRADAFRSFPAYGRQLQHASAWMNASFAHLKEAVKWTRIWWDEVENRPHNKNFVFNTAILREVSREMGLSLDNMEALVAGKAQIRSAITGETVAVDFPKLYTEPPVDMKAFLPIKFKAGRQMHSLEVLAPNSDSKKQKVSYRDYTVGKATDWNLKVYNSSFLPEAKSSEDVERSLRILSQSWGAWFVTLPFAGFVL